MEDNVRPRLSLASRELSLIMRNKGFMKDLDGWRKGFIFITAEKGQMKIGHTYRNGNGIYKNGSLTDFEYEEMGEWIKYFERI